MTAACLVLAGLSAGAAVAADPTITISGTVLDDDGAGLGGVDVTASLDSDDFETATTTDADGRYEVTVPLRGNRDYGLHFSKDGGWIPRSWGASGRHGTDLTDVNVQMVQHGSIRGAITSPTGSVENVAVELRAEQLGEGDLVETDADGTYRFDDVPPGHYWINFRSTEKFDRTSYGPDGSNQIEFVDIDSGQDVVLRTVGPRVPASPSGTIVADLTGTRRSYPEVTAVRVDGGASGSDQLYSDDKVATIDHLLPGQYKIALAGSTTWFGGLSLASATPVTVVAGKTTTITAQPGREAWVWGTIVNAAGDRLDGLNVEILRPDSPGEVIGDLVTSGGGFYSEDLPVADYYVRVTDPTGAYVTQTFHLPPDPESDDTYVLQRATPLGPAYPGPATASASGTYFGYNGPSPVCFVPTNGRRGDEMACGHFDGDALRYDIAGIKPGDYKVRSGGDADETSGLTWLGGRSYATATTVTFAAGEHKDLDVPGSPDNGHLIGNFTSRPGVPLPNVTVLAYAADNSDEIIASDTGGRASYGAGSGYWSMYYLPARPYKLKFVDPTGRYESTWFGGSSFATATAVTPRLADTIRLPDVTLEPRFGVLAPTIVSGDGYVGDRLSATTGFWTVPDMTFTYQWLRDGSPVAGADTSTYQVTDADLGQRLSVRVEGRDGSGNRATTTSYPTYRVTHRPGSEPSPPAAAEPQEGGGVAADPPASRVRPRVTTSVKRLGGGKVRLTVRYSGKGATPTGRVSVRRGGKTLVSWRRLKDGRLSVVLRHQPKGITRYTVRYSGSSVFLPDVRRSARVRVR